jgi:hypothetical protein
MWIITQLYGRQAVAKYSLRNLKETAPPHAQIHIWLDDPTQDYSWAEEFGHLHPMDKNVGIDSIRSIQLTAAAAAGIEEVYLTDTDAIHDPAWYARAKELYKKGTIVSLYNSPAHSKLGDLGDRVIQKYAPGISYYLGSDEIRRLEPHAKRGLTNWDFTVPDLLSNRCVISKQSYVEHLGAGGLHSPSWDDERADNPTPFLIEESRRILTELGVDTNKYFKQPIQNQPREMWIIAKLVGVRETAEACLANLSDTKPPHAGIFIASDHPTPWATAYGEVTCRRNATNKLLSDALSRGVKEVYLTNTDTIHAEGWYEELLKAYRPGLVAGIGTNSSYIKSADLGRLRNKLVDGLDTLTTDTKSDLAYCSTFSGYNRPSNLATELARLIQRTWKSLGKEDWLNLLDNERIVGKTLVINQPCGLGDILVIEPIIRMFIERGAKVEWLAEDQHLDLNGRAGEAVFVPKPHNYYTELDNLRYPTWVDGKLFLPFKWTYIHTKGWMVSKYSILGLDHTLWHTAQWKRDPKKEAALVKLLDIKGDYALVNKTFRTNRTGQIDIPTTGLPEVELTYIEGYNLLDWAGVIEGAKEIHTVATSLIFWVELLNTKAKLFLYHRTGMRSHEGYIHLLKKPWITTTKP